MEDLPRYHYLARSFEAQFILKQYWLSSKVRLKLSRTYCTLKGFHIPLHEEARREGTASRPFPTSHGEKGDIPPQQPQTMGRAPEQTPVCPRQSHMTEDKVCSLRVHTEYVTQQKENGKIKHMQCFRSLLLL